MKKKDIHSISLFHTVLFSSKNTINRTKTFVLYCIIEVGNSKYIINVGAIFFDQTDVWEILGTYVYGCTNTKENQNQGY